MIAARRLLRRCLVVTAGLFDAFGAVDLMSMIDSLLPMLVELSLPPTRTIVDDDRSMVLLQRKI